MQWICLELSFLSVSIVVMSVLFRCIFTQLSVLPIDYTVKSYHLLKESHVQPILSRDEMSTEDKHPRSQLQAGYGGARPRDDVASVPLNADHNSKDMTNGLGMFISIAYIACQSVCARKKLLHECRLAHAALFEQAIALNYLELHMRSKICASETESFLLLKHVKCLI